MIHEIILPKQGLQMTEGFITRWICKEGDTVTQGEPLFEMETDKLVITIDASCSGRLLKIVCPEGSTVPVASVIAYVGDEDGDTADDIDIGAGKMSESPEDKPAATPDITAAAAAPAVPAAAQDITPSVTQSVTQSVTPSVAGARIFSTPRARMRAEERGIKLSDITPTGPEELIIERDVLSYREKSGTVYMFSGTVDIFTSGSDSTSVSCAEQTLRNAFRKAVCYAGAVPCDISVHIIESRYISSGSCNDAACADITLCGGNMTMTVPGACAENDDIAAKIFELTCIFAEKPWLAAVK